MALSEKDIQILDFIYEESGKYGYPPSVREICKAVGLNSTATVHARLKKLEQAGFIEKKSSKNRSLRVINYIPECAKHISRSIGVYDDKYIEVPMIGNVTAGDPIRAVQEYTDTFALPIDFAKNKELFMLKVHGESMINAAILDGDYIIVQRQPTAMNGEIVVALIDNENATVKTFYKEKGYFRLQPENDSMQPIIVDEVSIIGKVVGVFRKI